MVEKLVPETFLKNQTWAYLWINSLKFYTVCFYYITSWRRVTRTFLGQGSFLGIRALWFGFFSWKLFKIAFKMRNLTHRWPQPGHLSQFLKKARVDLPPPPSSYAPVFSYDLNTVWSQLLTKWLTIYNKIPIILINDLLCTTIVLS